MYITEQNIPSELHDLYKQAFDATMLIHGTLTARKRSPFKIPTQQGGGEKEPRRGKGSSVTAKQLLQRAIFLSAVKCFRKQPETGGAEPPDIGPRNRSMWFTDALPSGQWYFNYFMQQTMNNIISGNISDWCKVLVSGYNIPMSNHTSDINYNRNPMMLLNAFGSEWELWFQRPDFSPSALFLYLQSFLKLGAGSPKYKIEAYNIDTDFDVTNLTWNTKPSFGNLINTFTGTPINDKYYGFQVSISKGLALKLINTGDENANIASMTFIGSSGAPSIKPLWV